MEAKLALPPTFSSPEDWFSGGNRGRKGKSKKTGSKAAFAPISNVEDPSSDDENGWEAQFCIDAFHYGNVSIVLSLLRDRDADEVRS